MAYFTIAERGNMDKNNAEQSTSVQIQAYIENAQNEELGGFTIPLPATREALQPFLDGIGITSAADIAVVNVAASVDNPDQTILFLAATVGINFDELNYLAAKIRRLAESDEFGYKIFCAAVETGRHCESIKDLINLTENVNRVYDFPEPPKHTMLCCKNADLSELIVKLHAFAGEFGSDAAENLRRIQAGNDYFMLMSNDLLAIYPAQEFYHKGSFENRLLADLSAPGDYRLFMLHAESVQRGHIIGCAVEVPVGKVTGFITDDKLAFTYDYVDAELRNGEERRFTFDEWSRADANDRSQYGSWSLHYPEERENNLSAHLSAFRVHSEYSVPNVSVNEMVTELGKAYTALAEHIDSDMLRVTPRAARKILARGDAGVYRLLPDGAAKLSAMDAVRTNLNYSEYREFAIAKTDLPKLDNWVKSETEQSRHTVINRDRQEER
jgi:hypothetical protein